MDAEYHELFTHWDAYPSTLIVPVEDQVREIYALFDYSPEYIIDQAVEACMSRGAAWRNIATFASKLVDDLDRLEEIHRGDGMRVTEWRNPERFIRHSDRLITIEQATIEMQRQFEQYKLYMPGGFLPYRFEHVLPDWSLVLKKCANHEEFFDRLSMYMNNPVMDYLMK